MSDQNAYDKLGLTESSSFEDIQEARNRLLEGCAGDRKQAEVIEAAYDAILMERLRLRQEGKIKVPDRIRFAEEAAEAPPTPAPAKASPARPSWLMDFVDTPSREDLVWPGVIFVALAGIGLAVPSLALAVGVGCTIYFLNRKEYRFWRSMLLTLIALTVGLAVGITIGQLAASQGVQLPWESAVDVVQVIAAAFSLALFWVVSGFLR